MFFEEKRIFYLFPFLLQLLLVLQVDCQNDFNADKISKNLEQWIQEVETIQFPVQYR
jgi:hypothetical protein